MNTHNPRKKAMHTSCLPTVILALAFTILSTSPATAEPSYAERLGWGPKDRVVVFHIDDTGMSHDSNRGTIKAMEEGIATSCSIMMPCPWVSEYAHYLKTHPDMDAGLHITLTAEWKGYRWGPVAGKRQVPGLVDEEGCFWNDVPLVTANATPDEVEIEIRAQIDRAETMGIKYTHLDSPMGTLFASPMFMQRYVNIGIEKNCPILIPGGHLQYISQAGDLPYAIIRTIAKTAWEGGLPVIDDVLAVTYDWQKEDKVRKFADAIRNMKPGITEFILHCTEPSENFAAISTSSDTRKGDLEAMLSPKLKKVVEEEDIILTTWRELKERRDKVGK